MKLETLKKIGTEWTKGEHHRIYFNDLEKRIGLEVQRYGTGNVSSAKMDGDKISNSKAKKILTQLGCAKIWFDVNDGEFKSYDISDEFFAKIIGNIKSQVQ